MSEKEKFFYDLSHLALNRFEVCILATQRARQLMARYQASVSAPSLNPTQVALEEIAAGKIALLGRLNPKGKTS